MLGRALLLFAVFAGVALVVYGPALRGEFVSDDKHYVWSNPYLHELDADNLRAILDPTSPLVLLVENYAPVHLLAHALEWQVFGDDPYGYHVVNVLLHALAATLLVALYRRTGIPDAAAAAGGLVFLLHPANVEAVAWVSQLKTPAAFALAAGALLAHPRRPALGAVLFSLALLAKPMAALALPVAAVLGWIHRARADEGEAPDWRWGWLAVWAGALALFAVAELAAFSQTAGTAPLVYAEPLDRLRSSLANGARYLAMTVGLYPLSTWHEPPPATSWLDPWLVAALVAGGAMVARWVALLRRRPPGFELAWWTWAAAGYAPFCGIVALPFAMADRYLYFVLPGLVGVALLAGGEGLARAARRLEGRAPLRLHRIAASGGGVAALALCAALAVASHSRARVWVSPARMQADAEIHYPEGRAALLRRAAQCEQAGDVEGMVAALREAYRRGYDRIDELARDAGRVGDHPAMRAFLREVATDWLARLNRLESPNQFDYHVMALAHQLRGETELAVRALERGLEVGGPEDEQIRADLAALRSELRRRQRREDPS